MFTDWAKTRSVTRGFQTPVTQCQTQSPYSGLAVIAALRCVSSVNTDDSRKIGSYYMSQLATAAKVHDFSLAW